MLCALASVGSGFLDENGWLATLHDSINIAVDTMNQHFRLLISTKLAWMSNLAQICDYSWKLECREVRDFSLAHRSIA
jgi:hypothetical protein